MPKPIIKKTKLRIDGKIIKQFQVSFNNSDSRILVLDNFFNMEEEQSQNTFKNVCYEVCSTLRKNKTFIYSETKGLTHQDIQELISKFNPEGIMFADIAPFSKLSLDRSEYFYYVRPWKKVPTILSTPISSWANLASYEKSMGNKATVGFTLKHLLAVSRGTNPFKIDLDLLKIKPVITDTIEKFRKFLKRVNRTNLICTDVEGASLATITNTMFTIQIGFWEDGVIKSYVIPWKHKDHTWTKAEFKEIRKGMRNLFMREDLENVFHFGQFDIGQLSVELNMPVFLNKVYDIPSAEFAIDENHKYLQGLYKSSGEWDDGFKPYSLEFVEHRYGIFRPSDMVIGKEDRKNMAKFSIGEIAEYGGFDIVSPLLIREAQLQQCVDKYIGHKSREDFLMLIHHQLGIMIKTFAALKNTGIHIDQKNARSLIADGNIFDKTAVDIRRKILETPQGQKTNDLLLKEQGITSSVGAFSTQKAEVFSLSKPGHLRKLCFDVLKLEPTKLGKSGSPSVDKTFQAKYKDNPIVKLLGHYNKVKILKSTFADGLIKIIDNDNDFKFDGRLRPILGFLYVLTGRLSSTDPNSQNIPTRSDEGFDIHKGLVKSIKTSFSVKHGRVMLGSDFSAHEVRMSGVIAMDAGIKATFEKANEAIRKFRLTPDQFVEAAAKVLALEGDVHIINVKFFFKQDVDKKHPLRNKIKSIVFGVLYGKLAKGLAKELGIEQEEAQSLIDIMFERWFSLKDWIDNTHKEAKSTFMVRYPNKRVAHMWAYLHDDIWAERSMDRRSVNYPIQGFSSDIGVASIYCYKEWVYKNITRKGYTLDSHHVNLVHDAQYSDVLYEHLPFAIYLTEHSMSTLPMNYYAEKFNYPINIPLGYGLEFGKNWASLEDWNFRVEGYNYEKDGKQAYAPGLLDMLRDEGKRMEKNYDKVIEDARWIMNVREKELKKDPYTMLIKDNTISRAFENMHMFRDQLEEA